MADRRRRGGERWTGPEGLWARLRREARAERPVFSAALQGRVLADVEQQRRAVRSSAGRSPARLFERMVAWAGGVGAGGLMAVALVAAGTVALRPVPSVSVADAVPAAAFPGIERLPTPGEIGDTVIDEVTTLAAAAVGMPAWADLAAFDPAAFAEQRATTPTP